MLMVNDRNNNSDSFWFTLFHEIGHIINGDFGISFEKEDGEEENKANKFAEEKLIPSKDYSEFIRKKDFSLESLIIFADKINRDPGIVLGRLQKENIISYDDVAIRNGIIKAKNYKTLSKQRFQQLKNKYAPYCSYASLYFYAHNDNELRWK